MIEMADVKHRDQILETIDQLRKRKARPDLLRICHMMERKYGCSPQQAKAEIERLVEAEIVIKVDYKGQTSYRNAAKWGKKNPLSGQVLNSNDVSCSLQQAVSAVTESSAVGATFKDIEKYLISNTPNNKLIKGKLQVALEREVVVNQLTKLSNGNFVVPVKKDAEKKKEEEKKPVATNSPKPPPVAAPTTTATVSVPVQCNIAKTSVSNINDNTTTETVVSTPQPVVTTVAPKITATTSTTTDVPKPDVPVSAAKVGECLEKLIVLTKKRQQRPSNKRKRFKKTHGPDFVENYDSSFEEPEPKCDYCLLTAACNHHGKPEELLFCKDCNAKAHPSCMDYSAELAMRSRMSPWQCMDCKTCYVCDDSGDADSMLFCDACDKGYHMGCHQPKINEKPSGKWVCYQCSGERKRKIGRKHPNLESIPPTIMETEETAPTSNCNNQTIDGAPGLPTPCESPVPEGEQNRQIFSYLLQNGSLTNDKENTDSNEIPDASDWSIDDVVTYFRKAGFAEQAIAFREQEIDGKSLLLLKRSDVLQGLSMKLGPALKIYNHVKRLQTRRMDDLMMIG